MIYFSRTANIAGGKAKGALAIAYEVANYVKDEHGLELEILMPIGGNPNQITWVSRYNSLADYETMSTSLLGDEGYLAMVVKSADYFIAGSIRDAIWRSM